MTNTSAKVKDPEFEAKLYEIARKHGATDREEPEPEEPESLEEIIKTQGQEIRALKNTVDLLSLKVHRLEGRQ